MKSQFDLIVIGTGTAGTGVAIRCRKRGLQVAVIDSRPFGGTCALRGCDPKKVLVGAAELMDWNRRMSGYGVNARGTVNWSDLMAHKRSFTEGVTKGREQAFQEAGITGFHGHARFVGPNQVEVDGQILEAGSILIATGAQPMAMPFPGADLMADSEAFLELDILPESVVFVGGGFIGMEFAHVAARAGARVQVIEMAERPLSQFDPELVDLLVKKSENIDIGMHVNTKVTSIEQTDTGYVVTGEKDGKEISFITGLVVHGAGRVPSVQELDLEKGEVKYTTKGIEVNEYMQSVSNPVVYAAGDVADSPGLPLTPLASLEAKVAAANILESGSVRIQYPPMPTAVFTVPQIASVGLTEAQAREQGYEVQLIQEDLSGWYTYRRIREETAMAKVVVDTMNDRVLGAQVLGGYAEQLINQLAMAIRFDLPASEVRTMIFAYPSPASDLAYLLPKKKERK